MSTPISEMAAVRSNARKGSPFFVVTANGDKNGMMPSAAIACKSRGAPVTRRKQLQLWRVFPELVTNPYGLLTCQWLEACTHSGEEWANENHPRMREGQFSHNQTASYGFAKSVEEEKQIWETTTTVCVVTSHLLVAQQRTVDGGTKTDHTWQVFQGKSRQN